MHSGPVPSHSRGRSLFREPCGFPGVRRERQRRDGLPTRPVSKRFPRTAAHAYPSPTQPYGVLFTPFLSCAGGQLDYPALPSGCRGRAPSRPRAGPRTDHAPRTSQEARGACFFIRTARPGPAGISVRGCPVPGHGGLPAARGCSRPRGAGGFPAIAAYRPPPWVVRKQTRMEGPAAKGRTSKRPGGPRTGS